MNKDQIKELRERLELSRKDMAEKLDCSEASLYNWETGANEPGPDFIKKLEKLALKEEIAEPVKSTGGSSLRITKAMLGKRVRLFKLHDRLIAAEEDSDKVYSLGKI